MKEKYKSKGSEIKTKKPKTLIERAREVLRLKHYSIRTEKAYIGWMRRYTVFHKNGI